MSEETLSLNVCWARTTFPSRAERVLFLAGPTPRDATVASWRFEALALLRALGFNGTVFVPEDERGGMSGEYNEQVEWERRALDRSDVIVFWVPRSMKNMPGLTTNDEFGTYKGRSRLVFGAPSDAEKVRYQKTYCAKLGIPVCSTLRETLQLAMQTIGGGAVRSGFEVLIPAHVFATDAFQHWRAKSLGENELLDARVRDLVMVGDRVFMFVLWAKIRQASCSFFVFLFFSRRFRCSESYRKAEESRTMSWWLLEPQFQLKPFCLIFILFLASS
jgi:hypothetical protein